MGFCCLYAIVQQSLIHKLCLMSWMAMLVETIIMDRKIIVIPDNVIAVVALACLFTTISVSVIKQKPKRRSRNQQKIEYRR